MLQGLSFAILSQKHSSLLFCCISFSLSLSPFCCLPSFSFITCPIQSYLEIQLSTFQPFLSLQFLGVISFIPFVWYHSQISCLTSRVALHLTASKFCQVYFTSTRPIISSLVSILTDRNLGQACTTSCLDYCYSVLISLQYQSHSV